MNESKPRDGSDPERFAQNIPEGEAIFKAVFEFAPDAVIIVDERGRIVLLNRQVEQMFGYPPAELTGQPIEALLPEASRRRHQDMVQGYVAHPRVRPLGAGLPLLGQTKAGKVFPVDITLGPIRVGERRLTVASVRDITQQKKAEEELQQYRDRLEELVAARTGELQNEIAERKKVEEQLRRNKATLQAYAAELARSNQDLKDFAAIASHDLQEPLRKILVFGRRLAEQHGQQLDPEVLDHIHRMVSAAGRMRKLLEDLLAYSQVSIRPGASEQVDLNRVAAEAISNLEIRLEETQGRVEFADLPQIEADRLQMQQLLQNLIANALKFHRPDVPPAVKIQARPADPSTGGASEMIELTVEDNGIGFDEQYRDRIFMPFQRLHRRNEYEGTGMGLALCRKIVERHAGTITAHSLPGAGSQFIIRLPVKQEPQDPALFGILPD